jgi:hypothetical protein
MGYIYIMKKYFLLLGTCILSACAQEQLVAHTPASPDSHALAECIKPVLDAGRYASAWGTASNECQEQKKVWMEACQDARSPEWFSDLAARDCEFELRELTNSLDKDTENSRPKEPKQATVMDKAIEDLNAGRQLPGLPNLRVPVYLSRRSLICPSLNALGNPNIEMLLITRTCTTLDRQIRVSVLVPTDSQSYLNSHVFGSVRVAWRTEDMSNGNINSGWVNISALHN